MAQLTPQTFASALAALPPAPRHVLAISGGLDSMVLLQLFTTLRDSDAGLSLHAVHVHHGLNPRADDWAGFCERACAKADIPLAVHHIRIDPEAAEGPEAAARHGRYRVFAEAVDDGAALVTAHHADDQGETFLLQALRGAGVAGLAAMPPWRPLGNGLLLRPLLPWTRRQLAAHAGQHGLTWVEDDSNLDRGFDRNFLRHEILPLLRRRWPGLAGTLNRASALQREARELLDELAAGDLAACRRPAPGVLELAPLLRLSAPRQANLLRHWLRQLGQQVPDHDRLAQILTELLPARDDAQPQVGWDGLELRRHRQYLYLLPRRPDPDPGLSLDWDLSGPLTIPGIGTLGLVPADGEGLDAAALPDRARVRLRQGGETLQPAGRREHHSLKKLLQETELPPWERQRLPLLFVEDTLVAVAGLWVAEGWQARPGQAGQLLRLTPESPPDLCPPPPRPVSSDL